MDRQTNRQRAVGNRNVDGQSVDVEKNKSGWADRRVVGGRNGDRQWIDIERADRQASWKRFTYVSDRTRVG